jgi:hypothetical protein
MPANASARRYYAQLLRKAAVLTGDRLLARAAAVLEPRGLGAPEIDDGLALAHMAALLEADFAATIYATARAVVRELGLAGRMRSERKVAQRLATKYRRALELAGAESALSVAPDVAPTAISASVVRMMRALAVRAVIRYQVRALAPSITPPCAWRRDRSAHADGCGSILRSRSRSSLRCRRRAECALGTGRPPRAGLDAGG